MYCEKVKNGHHAQHSWQTAPAQLGSREGKKGGGWLLVSHEPLNLEEGEDIAKVLMPGLDVDAHVDLSSACTGEEVCCV